MADTEMAYVAPIDEEEEDVKEPSDAKVRAGFRTAGERCESCRHLEDNRCNRYAFEVNDPAEETCGNGYEPVGVAESPEGEDTEEFA